MWKVVTALVTLASLAATTDVSPAMADTASYHDQSVRRRRAERRAGAAVRTTHGRDFGAADHHRKRRRRRRHERRRPGRESSPRRLHLPARDGRHPGPEPDAV